MSKTELVEFIAAKAGLTKADALRALEAGKEYEVDLNGYIYYASNKSTKWVILVHGYLMNGKLMASSLGQMYLDKTHKNYCCFL